MALYRPGDAYPLKGGTGPKAGYPEAEQLAFGFEENQCPEPLFPACSETGSYDDLRLVVYDDDGKSAAKRIRPTTSSSGISFDYSRKLGLEPVVS